MNGLDGILVNLGYAETTASAFGTGSPQDSQKPIAVFTVETAQKIFTSPDIWYEYRFVLHASLGWKVEVRLRVKAIGQEELLPGHQIPASSLAYLIDADKTATIGVTKPHDSFMPFYGSKTSYEHHAPYGSKTISEHDSKAFSYGLFDDEPVLKPAPWVSKPSLEPVADQGSLGVCTGFGAAADALKLVYDVTSYGATDDSAVIQKAVDAVTAAGGGTIFFPPSKAPYVIDLGQDDAATIQKKIGGAIDTAIAKGLDAAMADEPEAPDQPDPHPDSPTQYLEMQDFLQKPPSHSWVIPEAFLPYVPDIWDDLTSALCKDHEAYCVHCHVWSRVEDWLSEGSFYDLGTPDDPLEAVVCPNCVEPRSMPFSPISIRAPKTGMFTKTFGAKVWQ